MANITNAVRGTQDVLPNNSYRWQYIEEIMRETAKLYGYKEIRTPVFEHTELFKRSVGDTTDVVQKEMYTFLDKGERSITLRPEGTAGTVRSLLENGLYNDALPLKAYYITSCYRYEKPQAGRLREFHQFGIECFGASSPLADSEVIALSTALFSKLGVKNLQLEINSIGCPTCRAEYQKALKEYFKSNIEELCTTCLDRLERNPMRILDCKSPVCKKIGEGAPVMLSYICEECKTHFESVKAGLNSMGIHYSVNPKIVRGLDYYTKTVFEFISTDIGAQGTVCGGGRYDGLTEELGGPSLPSLGFGMGMERLLMVMEKQNCDFPMPTVADVYIAPIGEAAGIEALALCEKLRAEGFCALTDLTGRSIKAQMKYADKIGARNSIAIGETELKTGNAVLRNMKTGEQKEIDFRFSLVTAIYDQNIATTLEGLELSLGKI